MAAPAAANDGQFLWETLIQLNYALLDEGLPHQRRQLVQDTLGTLTGQVVNLWLPGDPPLTADSLMQQVQQTGRPATDPETGRQAIPVRHRKTHTLLAIVAGYFGILPPAVLEAVMAQAELAFAARPPNARTEQWLTIADVSRALASELDLDRLLQQLADMLNARFGYPFVHIFVLHPGRQRVELAAGYGPYAWHSRDKLSIHLERGGIIPRTVKNKTPILANNVYQNHDFIPITFPGVEIRAELTVPIIYGDEVLGVFDVESEDFDAFDEDDVWLLETLASHVAIAMRNALLYRSERWRRKAADSLRQIAGRVRARETLDNTLQAILQELASLIPLSFVAIWLREEAGYRLKSAYGLTSRPPETLSTQSWFDRIVETGDCLNRAAGDPVVPGAEAFPSNHDALGAVLKVDDNTLGVLVLVDQEPGRFGDESRRLAEIFASQAAIVIENTELYHKAKQQAWVSTALLQVAEATRNLQTLPEILQAVTRLSALIVGVEACAVLLYDESSDTHLMQTVYSDQSVLRRRLQNLTIDNTSLLAVQLAVQKEPVVTGCQPQQTLVQPPLDWGEEYHRLVWLPLLSQGVLSGVMMMVVDAAFEVSPQRLGVMAGIAYQTASAVQTVRLLEAQQEEAYVSAALLQVAEIVVAPGELIDVLEAIVRITPILTGVSHCLVMLVAADDSVTLAAAHGFARHITLPDLTSGDFPLLFEALAVNQPQNLLSRQQLPPVLQEHLPAATLDGVILPLSVKQEQIGALVVLDEAQQGALTGRRRDLVMGIAYQVALAVDNARLVLERVYRERLARDVDLARDLQASFMPQTLPELPGWDVATFWKMAQDVGGDFFDLVVLSPERLLIIIADVADKGLPAALFMARTSSMVRTTALEYDQPAAILSRLNQLILPDAHGGMFVSLFCAVLNTRTGQFSYASAGHNPPLLMRRDGTPLYLQAQGMVLGVIENPIFEQKQLDLHPGDGILCYTDGLIDSFNEHDELFGDVRLQSELTRLWVRPANETVTELYQAVRAFAHPNPQFDDFTLVLLKKL